MLRLVLFLLLHSSLFALISIVPVEQGEKVGWSGKVGASLSTKRGNSDTDSYKGALRLSYDNNTSFITWAEINGEYGEANNVKNVQKIYAHLRFIHNLSDKYHVGEIFIQSQEDEFKQIQRRRLIGAGYRQRLLKEYFPLKFFVGIGAFYEYIGYTTDDPSEDNARLNGYIAFTYPKEHFDFSFTSYYQPKFDDLSDFVTANKLELKIHLIDRLYLSFRVSFDYDSQPPSGVEKYDFYQDTAFVYEF